MIQIYGLKNCDTCRRARKWLQERDVEHGFHDVRADGLSGETLDRWIDAVGWEALLNRRGTTWRDLPDDAKTDVDAGKARALMLEHPALIKRPVIEADGRVTVGFSESVMSDLL
jgi:Spx/MgsR family transcriptional regulator